MGSEEEDPRHGSIWERSEREKGMWALLVLPPPGGYNRLKPGGPGPVRGGRDHSLQSWPWAVQMEKEGMHREGEDSPQSDQKRFPPGHWE